MDDFFIDVKSLPEGAPGMVQIFTLLVGYGYILYVASEMISEGSELLLLIPSLAGIVGSCVIPILGAVPDGMIVLFSGLGPDAQDQLDVGVGALAGSTVMLLTVPWMLAIIAGRVDLKGGKPNYRASPKLTNEDIGFGGMFVTGCGGSQAVREGGGVMLVTAVSYVIIQMPTFFVHDDESLVAAQKIASLIALFTSTALFFGYIWYQNRLSMADQEVTLRKQLSATIACIKAKKLTLKTAMYSDLAHYHEDMACSPKYSSIDGHVWDTMPDTPKKRLTMLLRVFFQEFDEDRSGVLSKRQVGAVFKQLGEKLSFESVEKLFSEFDDDHSGDISFDEFAKGTANYIWKELDNEEELRDELAEGGQLKLSQELSMQEKELAAEDEDEEEEVPEELVDQDPAAQQRHIYWASCKKMFIGTLLVVIFSDPMTDVLDEMGDRFGCSAFYTAFLLAPVASNASELITSYSYAKKKTTRSISISLQALQGAACMNNTFCLAIFMALIYFKGLVWTFTAETIGILAAQLVVALYSFKETQRVFDAYVVFLTYPACLALVATLEAFGMK